MSSNQPWYAGRHDAPNQHASPAVLESQRIYAHYPIAAGVPTHHGKHLPSSAFPSLMGPVARHINTLTGPAHPPSFAQPELYAPQGNPPPYSEYAPDVQYMAAPVAPNTSGGYWDINRTNATRFISAEAGPCVFQCSPCLHMLTDSPPTTDPTHSPDHKTRTTCIHRLPSHPLSSSK